MELAACQFLTAHKIHSSVYLAITNTIKCKLINFDKKYVNNKGKEKVKERIVLREIHLRTTGRHLSIGSHSITCYPTELTAPPSPQPGRLVLDLSTP